MNLIFYREETRRLRQRNYVYALYIIGFLFLLFTLFVPQNWNSRELSLKSCYFIHTWGALCLMSVLCDDLYSVRELGQRQPRLKKYAFVPADKKGLYLTCIILMAKYLMIYYFTFLLIYLALALLLGANIHFLDFLMEILLLLLLNAATLVVFTFVGIRRNEGLKEHS